MHGSSTHNSNPNFARKWHYAKMVGNTRISATDWDQDVRHIVFDTTGMNLSYQPGDVVDILPRNFKEDALAFLTHMKIDPNTVIYQFIPNDAGEVSIIQDLTFCQTHLRVTSLCPARC